MMAQRQADPREADTGAVLRCLTEWAGQFHDKFSPGQVTDVLVAFAFITGLSAGDVAPAASTALLRRLEEDMPSAGGHARALAKRLLASQGELHGVGARTQPGGDKQTC